MKIHKQTVLYIPAFHDEEDGGAFALEGPHYRSKREARKGLRMLYERGHTQFFIAEVTAKRSNLRPAKPSKRKVT